MPEKFTVEQKEQIVIESFTATNVAELCRRHGVSVAQFHRWKERFIEGGRKGLGESSRGNEYQREIDDLKRLVGDQALVIDALKKVDQGGNNIVHCPVQNTCILAGFRTLAQTKTVQSQQS